MYILKVLESLTIRILICLEMTNEENKRNKLPGTWVVEVSSWLLQFNIFMISYHQWW